MASGGYERTNQSKRAEYLDNLSKPFAQGSFKDVYRARYTQGPRTGKLCVSKFLRSGPSYIRKAFDPDLAVSYKAQELIDRFNTERFSRSTKAIYLNQPEVWTVEAANNKLWANQMTLVEPMIPNFQKYNSNSGWAAQDGNYWTEVMQALSHFSYHSTGGAYVVCDLQGGTFHKGLVLTDPVVLSRTHKFGPTDLGPDGIQNFFARHECNAHCRGHWTRPRNRQVVLKVRRGTSMMQRDGRIILPTKLNQPRMERFDECEEDDYTDSWDSDSDNYGSHW